MFDREIFVIDFETTGTLERVEPTRATEIGIVKLDKELNIVDTYQNYINPEEKLSDFIIKYTGITDDILVSAPKFSDIANDITRFIDGKSGMIAAWPLSFEMPILQYEYAKAGFKFPLDRRGIDIGTLAMYHIIRNGIQLNKDPNGESNGYTLNNISYTLGFSINNYGKRHSALSDAKLEAEVLVHLLRNNQ